jgi:primase-polymerase (primpol)-like protein
MKAYRQFIVCQFVPSATRPGKVDKLPINWQTGNKHDAHDSAIWLDYETAANVAGMFGTGFGVGFVFTEADPFWFLDIDDCLQPDGTWSPLALAICGRLTGAAVEVSQSGHGLHIFGSGTIPPHGCKNVPLGLELYHTGRFVALGSGLTGDARHDCTDALAAIVAEYFPPSAASSATPSDWTDGPCEPGAGVADDDALIRMACSKVASGAAFGDRASFADLWNNNTEALGRAWPSDGRAYDASSADMALATRLMFWTAKDCARTEHLMRRSSLARDKWERDDYMRRTVLKACAQQGDVFRSGQAGSDRRRDQQASAAVIGDGDGGLELSPAMTEAEMLARYVFVRDGSQVVDMINPTAIYNLEEWRAGLRSSQALVEVPGEFKADGTPKVRMQQTSSQWEKSVLREQVQAITFKPGADRLCMSPENRRSFNTWIPFDRSATPGDASAFLEHVEYLFGDSARPFLDWLAHIEQQPGVLPHSSFVHISPSQGTGRNWLSGVLARVWPGCAAVNFDLSGMLRSGFNGRLSRKILAVVDEVQEGGSGAKWESAETLKRIITEEYRDINPKYGRTRLEWNACRWLIFSNHNSALPLDNGDRRFNVVRNDAPPKSAAYYANLFARQADPSFIAAVAMHLGSRDLTGFNPGAHATLTEAKTEMIEASMTDADRAVRDVVDYWPVDVIRNSDLARLLGGAITPACRRSFERFGIASGTILRVDGTPTRLSVIRNPQTWRASTPDMIRAELARGPNGAYEPRHILDIEAAV